MKNENKTIKFKAMAGEIKPDNTNKDFINIHRVRTEFKNKDGLNCMFEVSYNYNNKLNNNKMYCCFSVLNYSNNTNEETYNIGGIEKTFINLDYTYTNLIKLINKTFNTEFTKFTLDNSINEED